MPPGTGSSPGGRRVRALREMTSESPREQQLLGGRKQLLCALALPLVGGTGGRGRANSRRRELALLVVCERPGLSVWQFLLRRRRRRGLAEPPPALRAVCRARWAPAPPRCCGTRRSRRSRRRRAVSAAGERVVTRGPAARPGPAFLGLGGSPRPVPALCLWPRCGRPGRRRPGRGQGLCGQERTCERVACCLVHPGPREVCSAARLSLLSRSYPRAFFSGNRGSPCGSWLGPAGGWN